ncbi:MAG: septal ring lytic transglycosylase RlpA family protein [Pseudomonadota bacterium]
MQFTGCAKRVESFRPGAVNEGYASWYGPEFHGRKTASGEVYDMNAFTGAHKQAPFGTRVRVTNLSNGRSTEVRINDRGPFIRGRIIDLSYAAAREIGLVGTGTARVTLAFLGTSAPGVKPQPRPPVAAREYFLQVGSFRENRNAEALLDEARTRFPALPARVVSAEDLHRVWFGPFDAESAALDAQAKLQDAGYETLLLTR